ncbi:MAG: ethanolamine ammonia-lyase reactivating factor EutA [Alicyclobacillus herbarius]|uniref:ethanolamine ammonia-lyase reactivating factor EutA n=1 Tax=Alicyclobacillus herbarius TaxID=122960 RepID=UPI002357769C|nr:ethanolamine ammonia-lyase reactivating factor EutA [Alicyclobacillus herbarius]MCL6633600.1 ethanolamine ammonia-lyase reactivating factor EutA [Alicyclobacillus herbarius]
MNVEPVVNSDVHGLPLWMHETGDDHFHDDEDWSPETDGLWLSDHFELMSVGMDIGSASTQVAFSRLTLHRLGSDLSSRYQVVERKSVYRSSIWLTPYSGPHRIDEGQLEAYIAQAYREAGIPITSVDTGAVILTGEAIRRENAEAIAHMLARQGGRFVCAIAGHNMEALLAAYGSGTVYLSHQQQSCLLNVDIGGGTTKLSVVEVGRVVETAALHIGGRLLATDPSGRVTRLEPAGRKIAEELGIPLAVGEVMSTADKERIAEWLAMQLSRALAAESLPDSVKELYITPPLQRRGPYDGVVFSGGVGEYVYGLSDQDFGDLGRFLGAAVRRQFERGQFGPLLHGGECLRATVVGASEYSVQVSGNTIFLSSPRVLPVRNVPVLHPPCDLTSDIDPVAMGKQILDHFHRFDLEEGKSDVALSFHFRGLPTYERMRALCEGVCRGLPTSVCGRRQVTILFDRDIAKIVGRLLQDEFSVKCPLLILDGIHLHDFDYVDIGRKIEPAGVVPVTVKSLVFQLQDGWDRVKSTHSPVQ